MVQQSVAVVFCFVFSVAKGLLTTTVRLVGVTIPNSILCSTGDSLPAVRVSSRRWCDVNNCVIVLRTDIPVGHVFLVINNNACHDP